MGDADSRKKKDPAILGALQTLLKDDTGGDPIRGIKWSRRSTRKLSRQLKRLRHRACARTVARLLTKMGYSLKANVKRLSGKPHPDRDRQFLQIGRKVRSFRSQGLPVISVDTKKKEVVANYYNHGRIWRKAPLAVEDHDFPDEDLGRAFPFGIYDTLENRGLVVVGTSHATASFAVDAVQRWWMRQGRHTYPGTDRVLVLCDNGGCNGSQNRLWKHELQRFADRVGITVDVAHYPPGASKWNPIEHRMFSFISHNWAGCPLRSYERILKYIRTTRTRSGLRISALLNPREYRTGIKISDDQMRKINLRSGRVLHRWNYAIRPRPN